MTVLESDYTTDTSLTGAAADYSGDWGGTGGSPGAGADYAPIQVDVTADDPDTVIMGLAPWGYWKLDDASGAPQDSSGNGRHATAAHATITYAQAPLSAKAGNSIALTAGGRIHFPTLGDMSDDATPFTIIGLAMFTSTIDTGPSGNGVCWLTDSQPGTQVMAGLFRNTTGGLASLLLMDQAVKASVTEAMSPPNSVPFAFAWRGNGAFADLWFNAVPATGTFRNSDYTSAGWDLGRNFGDSFFDMPGLRASNIAAWNSALTDAQLVAVQESLMDATIIAGAWTP